MKKKLTAILLAAAMAVTGLFTAMTPEKANAAEWEACDIPVIKDVSEFDAVSAMYSKTITVTKKDKNIEQGYGSFQLKSDSWVILKTTSSLVTSQEDGHQTHIEVFSDASASNKVLETGDGYWEYDGDQYTILKKGTYYFHTKSSCQNYDTFTGNINVVAAAIPTSKLIQTGVKKNSKKTSATVSFSNVLVQSSVNAYGATAMAGYAAYLKIDGFNILPVLSISMAVTTFTGQNVGANRLDRVKKGMYSSLIMVLVYTIFIGAVLLIFSHQVLGLFTHSAQVIMYGQLAMKYFCPYYFLLGILNVLAGTVRGAGKGIPPMIILLFSMCIFRILWIKIALPFYSSIDGVFILYPISWLVGAILMILYTKFGKWLPHKQMEKKENR